MDVDEVVRPSDVKLGKNLAPMQVDKSVRDEGQGHTVLACDCVEAMVVMARMLVA